MTRTVSFKLSEKDYQALCEYCYSGRKDKSEILRNALKKLCIPKFSGITVDAITFALKRFNASNLDFRREEYESVL
jgi:hypothetical protein